MPSPHFPEDFPEAYAHQHQSHLPEGGASESDYSWRPGDPVQGHNYEGPEESLEAEQYAGEAGQDGFQEFWAGLAEGDEEDHAGQHHFEEDADELEGNEDGMDRAAYAEQYDEFGYPAADAVDPDGEYRGSGMAIVDPGDEFGGYIDGDTPSTSAGAAPSPLAIASTPLDVADPWQSPGAARGVSPRASGSSRQVIPSGVASYFHIPSSPFRQQTEREQPVRQDGSDGSLKVAQAWRSPCRPSRCAGSLVNLQVRCPATFAIVCFAAIVGFVGLGMVVFPVQPDTSFDRLVQADVNSSLTHEAFIAATQARSGSSSRRLQDSQTMYRILDFSVAYELRDTTIHAGLLQHRIIRLIGGFERELRRIPEWKEFCASVFEGDRPMCDPGMSLINYALPALNISRGTVVPLSISPNGQGRDVLLMQAVEHFLQQNGLQDILLPKDYTQLMEHAGPTYLRSHWRFKVPVCTVQDPIFIRRRKLGEVEAKWRRLTGDVLLEKLQEAFQEADPVTAWWEGTGFDSLEVMQVLWQDIRLAAGSLLFVVVYLAIHTRSTMLTCAAFFVIPMSLPCAYIVFSLVSGSRSLGIINFLSVFVIVGLGADVVFVYTDTWRDSALHCDTDAGRLKWTYSHAGKATIATTATTALSFLANLASVLRALREFGLFMGLCVILMHLLISLLYVPFCLADERFAVRSGFETSAETKAERRLSRIFGYWSEKLRVVRLPCCLLPVLVSLVLFALSCLIAEPAQGAPSLFPADHNRNHGLQVFAAFTPASKVLPVGYLAPPILEPVCRETDFGAPGSCKLGWCEVDGRVRTNASSTICMCHRRPGTCGALGMVRMRLVGVDAVSQADLAGALPAFVSTGGAVPVPNLVAAAPAPSLMLQNWEAGSFVFAPVMEVTLPVLPPSCGWDDQCYCGTPVCRDAAQWQRQSAQLELQGPPAPSRLLASEPTVPNNRRALVEVVYGLKVTADSPLIAKRDMANSWSYAEGLDFRQPWAQRDLYRMCTEQPSELLVTSTACWIVDFRRWLSSRTPPERFPVTAGNFDRLLAEFAAVGRTGNGMSKHFLFIEGGTLKACWLAFQVDMDRNAGIDQATAFKEKWDRHVAKSNLLASEYMQGAFHVSGLWATTEAHVALVSSTAVSLGLVFVLAFLTIVVFTGDCCLSLTVIVATFQVVSGLFFFMVFVMEWKIGAIEALALIVFVGYALDYSMHVAQKYGSGEAEAVGEEAPPTGPGEAAEGRDLLPKDSRFLRTRHALKAIGGANLGSAITTTGCSVFLIFCQLTIFKQLGTVVVAVTVMSIVTALAFLPAMLMVVGPRRPGTRCCCTRRNLRSRWVRAQYLARRAQYLTRNLRELPAACVSLIRASPPEEAEDSVKDDSHGDESKSSNSSWRRRRLGLDSCFEADEIQELSLGLQASRVPADPILEVVRPGQGQVARAVVDINSRYVPRAAGGT